MCLEVRYQLAHSALPLSLVHKRVSPQSRIEGRLPGVAVDSFGMHVMDKRTLSGEHHNCAGGSAFPARSETIQAVGPPFDERGAEVVPPVHVGQLALQIFGNATSPQDAAKDRTGVTFELLLPLVEDLALRAVTVKRARRIGDARQIAG